MRLAVAGVLLACACGAKPDAPRTAVAPSPPPRTQVSPATLHELSILATATAASPDQLAQWSSSIARGERTLDQYVDFLLEQPEFARVIVPVIIGITSYKANYLDRGEYVQLKATTAKDGTKVLYLTKPCPAKTAVDVEPWWAPGTKVKVCPAAYKPDVWTYNRPKDQGTVSCSAAQGSPNFEPGSPCGCGPNLERCWIDPAIGRQRREETRLELVETIAHITEHDLPIQTIFSGAHTFRRAGVEAAYRLWQVESERRSDVIALMRDLQSWPAGGQWAPRTELAPGEHAGILTSHALLFRTFDRRQRQRNYAELMWCTGAGRMARGVHTEDLLALKSHLKARVGGEATSDWKDLAQRPICTECHARMDYGFQFFNGYPSLIGVAAHFAPDLQETSKLGPLYMRDIDDLRGKAPLTPAGFAALAMQQPEFAQCMSKRFAAHVFGVDVGDQEITAVKSVFSDKVTVKMLAKAALVRYASHPPTATRKDAPGTPANVTAALRTRLGKLCGDCHHDSADIPSLEAAVLPRELLLHSLDLVGSEFMPKGQALPVGERLELVRLLIDQLWQDPKDRADAYDTIAGQLQLAPTYNWITLHHAIDQSAGIPTTTPWSAIENTIHADQNALTPNTTVMTAIEAIRACKKAKATPLAACVERATKLLER